jgi:hypothetical protein
MYKSKYPTLIDFLTNQEDLILLDSEIQNIENLIDKDLKAINYTRCCTELKDKKALTFEEWLYLNNYAKSNDAKYLDENANWFTEKQLLKMYNDIF